MRVTLRRRPAPTVLPGITASARIDQQSRRLAARLRPGEIAVIDHSDLDRGSADALVAARPAAVLNVARSVSGRYPALGAERVVAAGIPFVDGLGPDLLAAVTDGGEVRVDGATVHAGDRQVLGSVQTPDTVAEAMAAARSGLEVQLEAFAGAASQMVRQESALLLEGTGSPAVTTVLRGRPVVVVAEGPNAAAQLRGLRRLIADRSPVLIGVETGADVLLAAGLRPQLVVGELDRVSDAAVQSGAELVLHTRRTGRAAGQQRLQRLGVTAVPFPYAGRSEDAALLLASLSGAAVIVHAGGCDGLVSALDTGRTAMASTFLTRMEVGGRLVAAPTAAGLHRRSTSRRWFAVVLAAQALLLGVAVDSAGGPEQTWQDVRSRVSSAAADLTDR